MFPCIVKQTALGVKQDIGITHYAIYPFKTEAVNTILDTIMKKENPEMAIAFSAVIFNYFTEIIMQQGVIRLERQLS